MKYSSSGNFTRLQLYKKSAMGVLGLLFLIFTGCSSSYTKYPSQWSPREQQKGIDYSGYYHPALAQILKGKTYIRNDSTNCLYDFVIHEDEVKYRSHCKNDSISKTYTYLSDPYFHLDMKQRKKGLQIVYRQKKYAGDPVAGFQKEYAILSKAQDGSLVVERVGKVVGLAFMFFPVAARENAWYRFYDGKVEILEP